jgi:hypothetical protein
MNASAGCAPCAEASGDPACLRWLWPASGSGTATSTQTIGPTFTFTNTLTRTVIGPPITTGT